MPWPACTQDGTRPPLISQAMWNIRKGSNSSLLQTSTKVFQKSGPSLANLTGLLQPTSTPITIVPPHITKSTVPINISAVLAALTAYLLLVQQSSNTEPATQQLLPTPPRQWRNPGISRVQVGMSWKSCLRRTMAIIQRRWDMAWDLTTHRNVESCHPGPGLPNIKSGLQIAIYVLHKETRLRIWPKYQQSPVSTTVLGLLP